MTSAERLRPGVTIVTTVFNKAYCLPLVIESLKSQTTTQPIEYIFVDDGSTDDGIDLLVRLTADLDNILILTQPNSGPTKALNLGLSLCGTKYTKGLDGDDILAPDAIEKLARALADNPACRWAYGSCGIYHSFPPDLAQLFQTGHGDDNGRRVADQLMLSIKSPHTNPSGWLAETDFLAEIGRCDEKIFIQDYSLELRMAVNNAPAFVEDSLYFCHEVIDDRRISSDGRQILHDCNLALANLFDDYPHLRADYGWRAAKRAAGRAWHWARRHEGKSLLSREYLNFVTSHLRLGDFHTILRQSAPPMARGVRRPGDASSYRVVIARGHFSDLRDDRESVSPRPTDARYATAAPRTSA